MGLDITAYRQIKLVDTLPEYEEYEGKHDWRETVYVHPELLSGEYFPEHCRGLVAGGVYEYAEEMGFRAGSYSGYNQWRDWLSHQMLGVPARTVWENEEAYRDKPFYFLIHFSDCEGLISGKVAKKLAQDFADHQERAETYPDYWWVEKYNKWRAAFEFAADNGLVVFH